MKNKWIEQFEPFNGGGGMIQNVDTKNITLGHILCGFFQFYSFDFNYEKIGLFNF